MSKTQATQAGTIETHRLKDLTVVRNIRTTPQTEVQKTEMKASIQAKGIIQNLLGAPRKSDGKIAVFGGQSRFHNALELIEAGDLPDDFSVDVKVYRDMDPESAEAIALAMTENVIRTQMDYVDECAAMLQLAEARYGEDEIAAIFGYSRRTVTERLLIAKLIPEAHELMRNKTRNLAWGRALTIADTSMQKQICSDIASSPDSWKTGDDIRKHLLQSTIPASNALFDLSTYTGGIISDMFDGDMLTDPQEFWTLQNQAISDLSIEIEAEGFLSVVVLREPFQSWRFEKTEDRANAHAFIEVLPNGKVNVIRDMAPIAEANQDIDVISLDEADAATRAGSFSEDIAPQEVRVTPSIASYAAAQRSAILQATLAEDFRKALEYAVLGLLGHRGASFTAQPFSMPGNPDAHVGTAFHHMAGVQGDLSDALPIDTNDPDLRERETVAMVRSMSDEALQTFFTRLVAQRAGQMRARALDDNADSLTNTFCADVDIRSWWTPDESFFKLMGGDDLRRLAGALLPGASATRFSSARKQDLVRALSNNFQSAKDGVLGDNAIEAHLNAWVPGVMRFPAKIATRSEMENDPALSTEVEDLDALLFEDA